MEIVSGDEAMRNFQSGEEAPVIDVEPEELRSASDTTPIWLDDKSINEIFFCEEFLSEHKVICVNDHLSESTVLSMTGL